MSSEFSNFQIAVLQQMGLTVWQSQDSVRSDAPAQSISSQPDSKEPIVESKRESAQDRLAGLRKTMADSSNAPVNKDVKSHTSTPAKPAKLDVTSLSQDARQILSDIQCAIEMTGLSVEPTWYHGEQLQVESSGVYFPKGPDTLSAQEKKQLWAKLSNR